MKNKTIEIQIMMNKGYTSQYLESRAKVRRLELLAYIKLAEIISKERRKKYSLNKCVLIVIDSVPPTID